MPGHLLYYDIQLHSAWQQILRNKWKNIPTSWSWEGSFMYPAVGIWNAYHKNTIKAVEQVFLGAKKGERRVCSITWRQVFTAAFVKLQLILNISIQYRKNQMRTRKKKRCQAVSVGLKKLIPLWKLSKKVLSLLLQIYSYKHYKTTQLFTRKLQSATSPVSCHVCQRLQFCPSLCFISIHISTCTCETDFSDF